MNLADKIIMLRKKTGLVAGGACRAVGGDKAVGLQVGGSAIDPRAGKDRCHVQAFWGEHRFSFER